MGLGSFRSPGFLLVSLFVKERFERKHFVCPTSILSVLTAKSSIFRAAVGGRDPSTPQADSLRGSARSAQEDFDGLVSVRDILRA